MNILACCLFSRPAPAAQALSVGQSGSGEDRSRCFPAGKNNNKAEGEDTSARELQERTRVRRAERSFQSHVVVSARCLDGVQHVLNQPRSQSVLNLNSLNIKPRSRFAVYFWLCGCNIFCCLDISMSYILDEVSSPRMQQKPSSHHWVASRGSRHFQLMDRNPKGTLLNIRDEEFYI